MCAHNPTALDSQIPSQAEKGEMPNGPIRDSPEVSVGGRLVVFAGVPDFGFEDECSVAVMVLLGPRDEVNGVPRVDPVQEEVQPLPQRLRLRLIFRRMERIRRACFAVGVDHRKLHAISAVWVHLIRRCSHISLKVLHKGSSDD